MKHNIELINGVAKYGSCFNGLWHGTIMETDVALWRGLPVPIFTFLIWSFDHRSSMIKQTLYNVDHVEL
jgi:hypothetical protein